MVEGVQQGPVLVGTFFKLQFLRLRSATCEAGIWSPPLSFWLKHCVILPHTHRCHPSKFHLNLKHHVGVLIFTHFARAACLLLAACCLLLAACLLACLLLNLVGPP